MTGMPGPSSSLVVLFLLLRCLASGSWSRASVPSSSSFWERLEQTAWAVLLSQSSRASSTPQGSSLDGLKVEIRLQWLGDSDYIQHTYSIIYMYMYIHCTCTNAPHSFDNSLHVESGRGEERHQALDQCNVTGLERRDNNINTAYKEPAHTHTHTHTCRKGLV